MRALAQWGRTNARLESCSDLAAPSIASKGYPSAQMREAIASDAVPRKNPAPRSERGGRARAFRLARMLLDTEAVGGRY